MKNTFVKFKNGFTLAEVLITLVIVGVIAAFTIPTAVNNTKDKELKNQFKKAYSSLSQVVYKTEMNDFQGYVQCYYTPEGNIWTECSQFNNAIRKNFSVQKVCQGNAKADGCVPQYVSYGSCEGFNENSINNINTSYILSDGIIVIQYGANGAPLFLVDINGHKGPNAYGKDLFSFQIFRHNYMGAGLSLESGVCEPTPVQGGRSTTEMKRYALTEKN